MRCRNPHSKRPRSLKTGRDVRVAFTLIELLVVAAIIIIIMAVTFPAYNKLTAGNSKKQALNVISAQTAAARSLALSSQRQVALIFYEDTVNKYHTRLVLAQAVQNTSSGTEFGAVPDRPPVSLPKFIKVANLDVATPAGAFFAEWGVSGQKCRALVFDERGTPVVRNGLISYDTDGSNPRSANSLWGLAPDGGSASTYGSSLSLVVYDITEFRDANPVGTSDSVKAAWLLNYSDIIAIHPYAGTVIR